MTARCDVIIPVKNAVWWVATCLEELFRHSTPEERGTVIVVDDSSTPRSYATLERICSRHAEVRLFRNTGRPGFGGACNFGVSQSSAPYVLLLNTDCLITRGTIRKLVQAFEADLAVGLACPLSNNSPVLTLPLRPGRSYLEMNDMLELAARGRPVGAVAIDACTVVGNCLMISRKCWDSTGEFDEVWQTGYGEETDFQMRAMQKGFRGVALINTYVYHFGSATFRYNPSLAEIQKTALARFLSTWGEPYGEYAARCAARDPVLEGARAVDAVQTKLKPDVLFILPGISQGVGGVHVVVDICNHLIRHGIDAKCAVLGELTDAELASYQEPIFFGVLHFRDEASLIADGTIAPRMVVATLYSTSLPAFAYSSARGIPLLNFIQGYEFYFENGTRRAEVEESYAVADAMITTSPWLEAGIKRHVPDKPVALLPIGVNEHMFAGGESQREKVRVAVVLRTAADKGQWVLQETLHGLLAHKQQVCVTVISSGQHAVPREWSSEPDTVFAKLPLDRGAMAGLLGECDVLVDASLHEGFGLVPLEAMAAGATVVASDSGGVNQFLRDGVNGFLVREVNKPERYLAALQRLIGDRELLARLRAEAKRTAAQFTEDICYERYRAFFAERLAHRGGSLDWSQAAVKLRIDRETGFDQLVAENQVSLARREYIVLRSTGSDPGLLLPHLDAAAASRLSARIDIDSPAVTTLQLFYPASSDESVLRKSRRVLRKVLRKGPAWGPYTEQRSVKVRLSPGRNQVRIELPQWSGGRLRLDPGDVEGDFLLRDLEIRTSKDARGNDKTSAAAAGLQDCPSFQLNGREQLTQFELIRQLRLTSYRALVLRATGEEPFVRLPSLGREGGDAMCLWLDVDSPAETVLTLFGGSRSSPVPDEKPGATEWMARRTLWKGRNVLVVPIGQSVNCLRLQPGSVPGDYVINKLEVRSLSAMQPEMTPALTPPETTSSAMTAMPARATAREQGSYPAFEADPSREEACRTRLVQYLTRIGQTPVEQNAEQLFSLQSGVCGRFDYLSPRMPPSTRRRLLISGCAAGSEMIIGRKYGFEQVCGTEVDAELVAIARERLDGAPGFEVVHYDGRRVPYENGSFTAVVSGHIIEHTPSPFAYLREHLRVLAPGGWLFLEFPDRYHSVELHTGLPSVEYLPGPLRSMALRYRASPFSRYSPEQRRRYRDILNTLQPVSRWQIALFLLFSGFPKVRIAHACSPLPGYVRMLIEKHA